VVELVKAGRVPEARLDESARRLLRLKFELGLFDDPFTDEALLPQVMGIAASTQAGLDSQRRAMTLLKNDEEILPLSGQQKVYVKNVDAGTAARYAEVVDSPQDADFAILRLQTPWSPVDTDLAFARAFHHGDLDFQGEVLGKSWRCSRRCLPSW
jgi:beta-glucosidase